MSRTPWQYYDNVYRCANFGFGNSKNQCHALDYVTIVNRGEQIVTGDFIYHRRGNGYESTLKFSAKAPA